MQGDRGKSTVAIAAAAAAAAAVTVAAGYALARPRPDKRNAMTCRAQNLVWDKPLSELPIDKAVPIVDGAYVIPESLVWCSRKQEFWWVDINGKQIMRLREPDGGSGTLVAEGWDVPTMPGSLVVREGGGREPSCPLLVAFEDGISLYDPCSGKRVPAAEPGAIDDYEQLPNTRLNDGRCDRQGRFVCGGVNLENICAPLDVWKPKARAYRVEGGKGVRRILPDEEFRCYNSTSFSPDGSTMYVSDSPLCKIFSYDYDTKTGDVSNKRVFVDLKDDFPDGSTVDSEGCVWVAIYGKGQVRRYSTVGSLLRTIDVPGAKSTTCVTIGGRDLNVMLISTATSLLSDCERLDQPNAGAIFALRLEGITGIPEPYYRG